MRLKIVVRSLILVLTAMIVSDCPVVAQSIQGSILGSVKDQTGAAVPNATVKITDTDTNVARTVTSNSAGDYQLLSIPADHYKVEVTASGFESQVLNNLTLTEFSVDGVTIQSTTGESPMSNAFPSGDSISELRVDGVLNNTEFGQPGEVTSITKGGTNHLHGSLFWYHQESAFNATPYGSLTKPHVVTNDYGITAGGPIVLPHLYNGHDKTFFFATYEGYRSPRATPYQSYVPIAAMKKGDFSGVVGVTALNNPFTGGGLFQLHRSCKCAGTDFLQSFPNPNLGNPNVYNPGVINYVVVPDVFILRFFLEFLPNAITVFEQAE